MKKQIIGWVCLFLLLAFWAGPWRYLFAQGTFVKLGSVSGTVTTYIDSTCALGSTCQYRVTAVNSVGESVPSNTVTATVPSTGTHTVTVSWTPGSGASAQSFNVYATGTGAPNPPTGAQAVVN